MSIGAYVFSEHVNIAISLLNFCVFPAGRLVTTVAHSGSVLPKFYVWPLKFCCAQKIWF